MKPSRDELLRLVMPNYPHLTSGGYRMIPFLVRTSRFPWATVVFRNETMLDSALHRLSGNEGVRLSARLGVLAKWLLWRKRP